MRVRESASRQDGRISNHGGWAQIRRPGSRTCALQPERGREGGKGPSAAPGPEGGGVGREAARASLPGPASLPWASRQGGLPWALYSRGRVPRAQGPPRQTSSVRRVAAAAAAAAAAVASCRHLRRRRRGTAGDGARRGQEEDEEEEGGQGAETALRWPGPPPPPRPANSKRCRGRRGRRGRAAGGGGGRARAFAWLAPVVCQMRCESGWTIAFVRRCRSRHGLAVARARRAASWCPISQPRRRGRSRRGRSLADTAGRTLSLLAVAMRLQLGTRTNGGGSGREGGPGKSKAEEARRRPASPHCRRAAAAPGPAAAK